MAPKSANEAMRASFVTGFGILGTTVYVRSNGDVVRFPRKTSQTLALLVTASGSVVSVDRIVRSLWGERPPSSARVMVREHVKRVRAAVGTDGVSVVASDSGGYRVDVPPVAVDASMFEQILAVAATEREAGHLEEATASYTHALAQWRDSQALADVRDVVELEADAVRLDEMRFQAEQWLIECQLLAGRADRAMPRLLSLTVRYPERERFWALLMVAQCALGRRLEAGSTFRRARRTVLARDAPDLPPEMLLIEEAVLAGTPAECLLEIAIGSSSAAPAGNTHRHWSGDRYTSPVATITPRPA